MFGALNVSSSALVAQQVRMDAISANQALSSVPVDPNADPDDFRRRIVVFAPGDPATGGERGVHVQRVLYDQAPFMKKWEPGHPFADEQGYVRYPNIDPAMEAVNALEAARAYEANITAAEATKNMLRNSLRLLV